MATNNITHRSYPAVPPPRAIGLFERVGQKVASFFTTGFLSCCFGESDMLRRDNEVREGIRNAMFQYRAPDLGQTMVDIYAETGYCLTVQPPAIAAGVVATPHAPPTHVRVFPTFAADMVVLLQSNLGTMAPTEANVLLVEREYHRVCRKLDVRHIDQAVHRQHILNAFFTEGALDAVAHTRSRIPRWLRVMGYQKVTRSIAI
jgi:hypothetical protein